MAFDQEVLHGPIFTHPDFAEHAEFLGRPPQDGVLVAAGPLTSVTGRVLTG